MTPDTGRTAPGRDDARSRQTPRLLIADDDLFVQSALCAQLDKEFDIVGGALDADEAIELAERHQPDVAIIDVEMPAGGGLRAAREIHERAPGTAIVALSSDESSSVVLAMLNAGAITYLRKGMTAHELTRILHSSISAHVQTLPHTALDTFGN
jgi:DNA-binding NarL/FixJ family response regulator